jgi:hypothetical protein
MDAARPARQSAIGRLRRRGIIDALVFQDGADVSAAVENANDGEEVVADQVIDAQLVKTLDRPGAQAGQVWIG